MTNRPISRVEQDFIQKQKNKAIWKEANKSLFYVNDINGHVTPDAENS